MMIAEKAAEMILADAEPPDVEGDAGPSRGRAPVGNGGDDRTRRSAAAACAGFSSLTELSLADGRRADIIAVNQEGEVLIVEVKSCAADFRADRKWRDYVACCDRLYFAISEHTPAELMPLEAGLIVADPYGAEILREAELKRMAPASRRALLLRFAAAAADRLHRLADPAPTPE